MTDNLSIALCSFASRELMSISAASEVGELVHLFWRATHSLEGPNYVGSALDASFCATLFCY